LRVYSADCYDKAMNVAQSFNAKVTVICKAWSSLGS